MYRVEDFRERGLYIEKSSSEEHDFGEGSIVQDPKISDKMKQLLRTAGGSSHGGDFSRQDSAVITSLLTAGYSPEDTKATFMASARGRHAIERKEGHVEDYIERTVRASMGLIQADKVGNVNVDFAHRRNEGKGLGLIVSMAHEVETEKTRWLWQGYIPSGKLTIVAGDPGMGKSTMVLDLVSRISKGTFLPSGSRTVTGTCLVASAEDAPEDTIVPRLIAANADLKRIGVIREVREDVVGQETRFLSLPRDLHLLKDLLVSKGCRVLIIDPLNAFLEKGTDTYKDQDMRLVLHPLEAIAEETGTSILVVAHLNKKEDTSSLYRIGGSIGFIGAARSVLSVARMADGTRVLFSLKSNLSQRPPSLSYETKQVRKQRKNGEWLGEEIIHSSGIRWLGEVEFDPFSKSPEGVKTSKESEEVVEFLRQTVQEAGEIKAEILFKEARVAGISKSSLQHVRPQLGIKIVKRVSGWVWKWTAQDKSQDKS